MNSRNPTARRFCCCGERYFENRPFAEVGAKLGLNENAARMRVERALEKLRLVFAGRNITTATALASVISANARANRARQPGFDPRAGFDGCGRNFYSC